MVNPQAGALISLAKAARFVKQFQGCDLNVAALESSHSKFAVDADWEKSHSYGVTGVPTYVSNGQGITGAQPYDVLQKLMHDVGAQKRSR